MTIASLAGSAPRPPARALTSQLWRAFSSVPLTRQRLTTPLATQFDCAAIGAKAKFAPIAATAFDGYESIEVICVAYLRRRSGRRDSSCWLIGKVRSNRKVCRRFSWRA